MSPGTLPERLLSALQLLNVILSWPQLTSHTGGNDVIRGGLFTAREQRMDEWKERHVERQRDGHWDAQPDKRIRQTDAPTIQTDKQTECNEYQAVAQCEGPKMAYLPNVRQPGCTMHSNAGRKEENFHTIGCKECTTDDDCHIFIIFFFTTQSHPKHRATGRARRTDTL